MVAAVEQRDGGIDDRVAGQDARLQRLLHTGLYSRNVLLRDGAALRLVDELGACAPLARRDLNFDDAELAATAGLPHEAALGAGGARDRLLERDLRPAHGRLYPKLTQHPVDEDL